MKYFKIYISIYCLVTLFSCNNNNDELKKIGLINKDSSNYLRLYNVVVDNIHAPDSIYYSYFDSLAILTKQFNEPKKDNTIYNVKGKRFFAIGFYDSSNVYFFKALDGSIKLKSQLDIAKALSGISPNYMYLGNYELGVKYMQMYYDTVQKYNIKSLTGHATVRLATVLRMADKPSEALNILYKGLKLPSEELKDEYLGDIYDDIGSCYSEIFGPDESYSKASMILSDSAELYSNKALAIRIKIKDSLGIGITLNNMTSIYDYRKEYDKCIKILERAILIKKHINAQEGLGNSYSNLGIMYFYKKDYIKSNLYSDTAETYYKRFSDTEGLIRHFEYKINFAKEKNDFKSAFEYIKTKTQLQDSIKNTETTNKINELDIKFRTKENENTIAKQVIEINKQKFLRFIIIGSFAFIGIIAYLLFRGFKNKKNKQLIQQENEASLKIIQSEQSERMRIARELHDGIGQKLTVLKMYASAKEDENKKQIELLDSTITEVRAISHNLMPEIINLGLVPAVKDLCAKINEVGAIKCVFNYNESKPLKFDTNIELSIYRIIQEVLNNMIKHANAKKINVSFDVTGNNLKINISDDGVGFDTKKIYTSSGIGWSNIITRAKIINANVDVNSNNKGTNIVLNINI